ncbi:TIR domain-containing protein [Aquimarina litoralis]|uniref:TIR domain-containing protein n=1 Tax=Aquimarina litoralis TaxID=584605 RepID=UPI001C560A76|nr:TIR domain-containing protein [Aquimarina litoralis]MBW1298127.1 molecular chaperone Tir [Aquimarina litoralis]
MGRKCFISFKTEDSAYKDFIQNNLDIDMIDKSLNEAIDSDNEDYIMSKIRKEYLSDSTVTIHLIGKYSAENRGKEEQRYIKRELQASLYHGKGDTRSGILGVVLPEMESTIYRGSFICPKCSYSHNYVGINDTTVIKEFSANYYIQNSMNTKCSWSEEDRYCVLVKWDDFLNHPEGYIEYAIEKRSSEIANKIKVYP